MTHQASGESQFALAGAPLQAAAIGSWRCCSARDRALALIEHSVCPASHPRVAFPNVLLTRSMEEASSASDASPRKITGLAHARTDRQQALLNALPHNRAHKDSSGDRQIASIDQQAVSGNRAGRCVSARANDIAHVVGRGAWQWRAPNTVQAYTATKQDSFQSG